MYNWKAETNVLVRMWRNWTLCPLLVECKLTQPPVQKSLVFPQEVKHRITIWPSKSTLRYIYKRTEHSNKSLYSHVYSNTIPVAAPSTIAGTSQTSISGWNDRRILVHPCSEIVLSYKNDWSELALCTLYYNFSEPGKHYAEWEKPDPKGHILCDSIHMKYPRLANP